MAGSSRDSSSKRPVLPVEGTRLESIDEIREAIKARRTPTVQEKIPVPEPTGPEGLKDKPSSEPEATPYRPLRRPPLALLCVMDDGLQDGEWVRLRGDRLVIGRTEGEVVIPHDSMMSSRHAELSRQQEQGRYRWYLTDLQSTNGTYVRVGGGVMKHQQELLIGSRLYRFDAAPPAALVEEAAGEGPRGETRGWQSVSPSELIPSLVELTPRGEGQRFFLTKSDNGIGRDSSCTVILANDPLVSPRHARLYRDSKNRWHVENTQSINGIWLRIDRMALDGACQFQLGEQRFLLRVP